MDVDTAQAIDALTGRIDALEESIRGEIQAGDASLRAEMQAGFESLRAEIRTGDELVRADLHAEILESRRHSQMLFESLHDDIRIVAEGLAMLAVKVDRLLDGHP